MLTSEQIIRAWKDEDYRENLTDQERRMLPANPAGEISSPVEIFAGPPLHCKRTVALPPGVKQPVAREPGFPVEIFAGMPVGCKKSMAKPKWVNPPVAREPGFPVEIFAGIPISCKKSMAKPKWLEQPLAM
jgi:mersacidin/lichenicidin family type 2 lantibiotic